MSLSSRPSRWLLLILALIVGLGALAAPADAADSAVPQGDGICVPAPPAALFGGLTDSILGNRQRMIQFAFVGFGIGVLILMTATRKH